MARRTGRVVAVWTMLAVVGTGVSVKGGDEEKRVRARPSTVAPKREAVVARRPGGIERQVQIQGPGGATYRREMEIQRTPGGVSRSLEIDRPGGARYESQAMAQRIGPRPMPMGGPTVVQRNLTINRFGYGGPPWGPSPPVYRGGSSVSLFFGSPWPPPPVFVAPVVPIVPAPVVIAPPANVVVMEPERYRVEPETIVVDPVAESLKRLSSSHGNSRRDGARELGRLGDARAVAPLLGLLRDDRDADVRAAAAMALGEIGDPRARAYLERAAVYDKKAKVREEAARAVPRLVLEGEVVESIEPAAKRIELTRGAGERRAVPPPPLPGNADPGDVPWGAGDLLPDPLPPLDEGR